MADADDDWSDLEAADEPVERPSASARERSTPSASAGGRSASRKRRGRHHDDGKEIPHRCSSSQTRDAKHPRNDRL